MPADTKLTVTTPTDTQVAVERTFDAPARLIWNAHTKPELIKQWLTGPEGWSMPLCEVDLRVGGAYRYEWTHPAAAGFGTGGKFTAVDPVTHLAFTEPLDGFEGEPQQTNAFVAPDARTTGTKPE